MLSRRAFVMLPGALGLAAAGCRGLTVKIPRSIPHPLVGLPAPDFEMASAVSSEVVSVPGPRDTTLVTVIDFWASWCAACLDSMPALEQLYRRNRDAGVQVIGVSVDEEPRDALGTVNMLRTSFPIVLDQHGRIQGAYAVGKIPTTFVLDRNGLIRWVGRDPAQMEQAVDRLLAIAHKL